MNDAVERRSRVTTRNVACFAISVTIAIWYFVSYWDLKIGISPFHIGTHLPVADWIELFLFVILPLAIGISCAIASGRRLRWFVLPAYPIAILACLF